MLMRSPLQGITRHPLRAPRLPSLTQLAIAILRSFGTNAHVYIPGSGGVAVSGLLSNNYTLSDGSSGYSAVDGTCGLALDAAGSVGAELITNGSFDSGTGWGVTGTGVSFSGGQVTISATSGYTGISQTLSGDVLTTKTVRLRYTVISNTLNVNTLHVGGAAGRLLTSNGPTIDATVGEREVTFTCTGSGNAFFLQIANTSTSGALVLDNISIKEVTGIHATQSTTANKPALRRGLYNLLTYSNDQTNGAWVSNTTWVTILGQVITDAGTGDDFRSNNVAITSDALERTFAMMLKKTTGAANFKAIGLALTGGTIVYGITVVNTNTGVISSYSAAVGSTPTISDAGDYWLVTRPVTNNSTGNTNANCRIYAAFNTDGTTTKTQSTTGSTEVGGAGLFQGTLTASQILAEGGIPLTTSAAASNQSAGRYWLDFDGGSDYLQFGSLPFVLADDFLVVAAVNTHSLTTTQKVFSLRGATANPLIELILNNLGRPVAQVRDDAGVLVDRTHTSALSGMAIVSMWKVGTNVYLRVNGVQSGGALSVSGLGATTLLYAAAGAALVAGSPSIWFDGAMGPMIPIKGTFAENDVLTIERLVAANAPNGPVF